MLWVWSIDGTRLFTERGQRPEADLTRFLSNGCCAEAMHIFAADRHSVKDDCIA